MSPSRLVVCFFTGLTTTIFTGVHPDRQGSWHVRLRSGNPRDAGHKSPRIGAMCRAIVDRLADAMTVGSVASGSSVTRCPIT